VHAEACTRFASVDELPAFLRTERALVSVRPYDAEHRFLYALGDVAPGLTVDTLLSRSLDDRQTRYVNVHSARPGCFLFRVERA
jgi:hypothetical protein